MGSRQGHWRAEHSTIKHLLLTAGARAWGPSGSLRKSLQFLLKTGSDGFSPYSERMQGRWHDAHLRDLATRAMA